MTAQGYSLDHVGYVGSDLSSMIDRFHRLGLRPTKPEGLHLRDRATAEKISMQQQSCHVVMQQSYLELTAVASSDPTHHLAAWRTRAPGAQILALGTADLEAARRRCCDVGLQPTAIAHATRSIAYGPRCGDAQFDWFMLPASAFPAALLCVVSNRRPDLVYQREVMDHPLGVLGLRAVTFVDPDPARSVALRLDWLTQGRVAPGEALRMSLAADALTVLTPIQASQRFGEDFSLSKWRQGAIAAVTLGVASLGAAARTLTAAGVEFRDSGLEIQVASAAANGAVLVLQE